MLLTDMDKALPKGKNERFGGCDCTAAFILHTKG